MDAASLDRFKDPALAQRLLARIDKLAAALPQNRELRFMEVCGTHTVAIARAGLRSVLPANISLLSGPGCPVCVTANADLDRAIAATRLPHTIVASFGDMLRVPGSTSSLAQRKAEGAAIEVVYSPLDALALAQKNPERELIFVAVGFETTTPLTAATVKRAAQAQVSNFSVLTAHKRVPPALEALANDPELTLSGLILPGHVSTILGELPYEFIAERFGLPAVIAGFDPVDLLLAVCKLVEQLAQQTPAPAVHNAYQRAVRQQGNEAARALIDEVFTTESCTWRGLGTIADSAHVLKENYAPWDASKRFDLAALTEPTRETPGCSCGKILRGVLNPSGCKLFGGACTPENPLGPCMVSSEGSCAAWYRYYRGAVL